MSVNVTMPKLGMTMKVGKVSKWYKEEGDSVEKGENLFSFVHLNLVKTPICKTCKDL